ncbi:MAG: hypothetical protein Q4C74_01665 [Rothia sp. (in: high G+C Gram-positive bacteria)]|nr:hypothetical protein [Rothia sp. (in: high G+C Gram-positive bacteria)]
MRQNLIEELLTDTFGLWQLTISRTIHRIENALSQLADLTKSKTRISQDHPRPSHNRWHLNSGLELAFTRVNTLLWQT